MGLSYLVVTTHMFFFTSETKSSNREAISSMGAFPRFGEGGGTVKKKFLARPSKKMCPKCMLLGTSGVIWGDLGTFWSDFSDFRMQNHSVL